VPGRGAQALPSFLTALPLTHLDVSACRAADLSVVAEMTSLVTLSLQVWPGPCRDRPRAPACARPPAACSLRPAAERDEARSEPCSVRTQTIVGKRREQQSYVPARGSPLSDGWAVERRVKRLAYGAQGMDLSEDLASGAPWPQAHAALVRRLLPPLQRLTALTALNLAGNLFTRVPAVLGRLSALEFLDLSNNPELQARRSRHDHLQLLAEPWAAAVVLRCCPHVCAAWDAEALRSTSRCLLWQGEALMGSAWACRCWHR
jgi:hypothetical protein